MQPNAVQEVIMTYNFWILELFDANNRDLIVFKFFFIYHCSAHWLKRGKQPLPSPHLKKKKKKSLM